MAETPTLLKKIRLAGTKEGVISVYSIKEPYGKGSLDVISIGISLKEDDKSSPNWKVHIPYENIDSLIKALKDAKDKSI